jgi:chromosome segregation ATPase
VQVSLQQKDNEMKLLTRMHTKSMKQLEQKHRLDLERENYVAEKSRHATEQKLQQTRREGEAQRKRLQGEIAALSRATAKFENEMQTKIAQQTSVDLTSRRRGGPTLSHARSDVADFAPTTLGKTPEVQAEIDGRLVKFAETGKMELAALAKAVESVEQQFRAEEERMNLKLREIHREREFLIAEKQRNLAKIKEMQAALDALHAPKPREAETVEAELNAKIAAQHAVIAEMNRELQERKADQTKNVDLAVIWQEHEAELAQLRNELERMEAENATRVQKMKTTYEATMKAEKERADKAVGALRQRYEQVMEEIRTTRNGFKDQELLDQQKWVATRKEMADSNNRILGTLQPREPSRPTSSVGSGVSHPRSRPLPALKR